jgi:WD40 repeat protein
MEQFDTNKDNTDTDSSMFNKLLVLLGFVVVLGIAVGGFYYYQILQEVNHPSNNTPITFVSPEDYYPEIPIGKLYFTAKKGDIIKSFVWDLQTNITEETPSIHSSKDIRNTHISPDGLYEAVLMRDMAGRGTIVYLYNVKTQKRLKLSYFIAGADVESVVINDWR